jgi:hypothetical protein
VFGARDGVLDSVLHRLNSSSSCVSQSLEAERGRLVDEMESWRARLDAEERQARLRVSDGMTIEMT